MKIESITEFSTIDVPDNLSSVIWTIGCPLRCFYCHNKQLQISHTSKFEEKDIYNFLESKKGLIDYVVFSGGEPTIHDDLPNIMAKIQRMGFNIGLHTSGIFPVKLKKCFSLCDWIGIDFKNPSNMYMDVVNIPYMGVHVLRSIKSLAIHHRNFEVRTTYYKNFNHSNLIAMGEYLSIFKNIKWVIQECFQEGENNNISDEELMAIKSAFSTINISKR